MEGSQLSNPVRHLALALLAGAAAALFAVPVPAADPAASGAAVGPPTPLFTPSPPPAGSSRAQVQPMHAAVAAPGKHPATPVQRIPLDAKPLIPPAAAPAKLGPPPEPRPALSLETDLEPLAPATSPLPPAAKPPSS